MNARIVFVALVLAALLYPPWSSDYLGFRGQWRLLFLPPGTSYGIAMDVLALEIAAAAAISYGVAWARRKG